MKKTTTLFAVTFALCMFACTITNAQSVDRSPRINSAVSLSKEFNTHSAQREINQGNQTQSLWDIQFDYDISLIRNGGAAACVFTGTEFWVSKWNYTTLVRFDAAGAFIDSFAITGVGAVGSGVRQMTYDGTYIYAAVNTSSICIIDPVLHTLTGTILCGAPINVRSITYDSTANSGAGGFWVSNYGTDFYQISMTGAVLDNILASEHALTSVYNIAFDPYTVGGPYLWAYSNAGNEAKIYRVSIPLHQQTGVIHDTNLDIAGGIGGGIGGGLCVTWRYDPNHFTLVGVIQGTLHLFGYELNDFVIPAVDASVAFPTFTPPYTIIPNFEFVPYDYSMVTTNLGSSVLSDLESIFYINDGTSNVYSPASQHNLNVASNASVTANFGTYGLTTGSYQLVAKSNTGAQTDLVAYNDSAVTNLDFSISDTVYAREDGVAAGSLGIGDGIGGTLGQIFTLARPGYISSLNFLLNGPTTGDNTSAVIYNFTTQPTNIIASSAPYTFTGPDSNGVALTLMMNGGPVYVPAGTYFAGITETAFNVTLANTFYNYRDGSGWVTWSSQPWTAVELLGTGRPFAKTYILRLDVLDSTMVGIAEIANEKFTVYPNPASAQIHFASQSRNYKIELFDMTGKLVQSALHVNADDFIMDVSKQSAGIYNARITSGEKSTSLKVSIQR